MTAYSVNHCTCNSAAMNHRTGQQQQQQHPPVYTPSHTGLTPRSTFDAAMNASNASPAPSAQRPSCFGQKFHSMTTRAGRPLNKAANIIGAEGWWPTDMQKECSKAARILHSFTTLSSPEPLTPNSPIHPTGISKKSMVKIPEAVLRNCAGLAIFNVLRAGAFHGSVAAGSGVVVARRHDGTWSPPSSFVVTTIGAGFMLGLDIYDCVCVLNTADQVHAFTNPRLSLGGDASIAIGPIGTGASVDAALSRTVRPMWSYMKSRGLWAGLQVDGTVIVSRADANAAFYNERGISARRILQGDVAWPMGAKPLFEVLRALEGRNELDRSVGQVEHMGSGDAVLDEKREPAVVEYEHHEQQTPVDESILDEKKTLKGDGN